MLQLCEHARRIFSPPAKTEAAAAGQPDESGVRTHVLVDAGPVRRIGRRGRCGRAVSDPGHVPKRQLPCRLRHGRHRKAGDFDVPSIIAQRRQVGKASNSHVLAADRSQEDVNRLTNTGLTGTLEAFDYKIPPLTSSMHVIVSVLS